MNFTLEPGSVFPDIDLPDHVGNPRRLSQLAAEDPVLLQFYRGWWCPKEQAFFQRLTSLQDEAEVAYTRFVSVSVDPPEVAAAFRAGAGARWTFLCDTERRWLDALGLAETADTAHQEPIDLYGELLDAVLGCRDRRRHQRPRPAVGPGRADHRRTDGQLPPGPQPRGAGERGVGAGQDALTDTHGFRPPPCSPHSASSSWGWRPAGSGSKR